MRETALRRVGALDLGHNILLLGSLLLRTSLCIGLELGISMRVVYSHTVRE